ncbi:WD40-repeat-containing domain superfamily [Sesbania bispinosa]|nr:WD40-repeat-containing domain superfamily [Sesbania bispinosa]
MEPSYLRSVSSGASTVARSAAASVASSIVDRDDNADCDQVIWAGFDKLEGEGEVFRQVLLLGYRSGFQVWDVDDSNNVCNLVYRHDDPVSFMQMVPSPIISKRPEDKFADRRPLLAVCTNGFFAGRSNVQDGLTAPCNGGTLNCHDQVNGNCLPTTVQFYSMSSQSYIHVLKFRSTVFSVRIHCFDVTTLEREYTLLTNPIVMNFPGSGAIGYGPLAVGPRWLAYSGSPVAVATSGRVNPQHLTPSASFPGFSSMGAWKLSRYCSELLPDGIGSLQSVNSCSKGNGIVNGHSTDVDHVGMVIVRDIVSKNVIAQFRAHESPISALCFDPNGTLLVTASVQGHNINVFKILPGYESLSASDAGPSYVHLYKLQTWLYKCGGSVNIQSYDNSFTGKNGGLVVMTNQAVHWPQSSALEISKQHNLCAAGPPIILSVVSRIRNGSNGWRGTVTGAAAAATGRMSSLSGAIASAFCNFKGSSGLCVDGNYSQEKYNLLVFSPTGSMIQYALQTLNSQDSTVVSGLMHAYESTPQTDARVVVEAIQKWNIRELKKDSIISPKIKNVAMKSNSGPGKEHHLYISEAELQMHQAKTPLWAKTEIYFHSMGKEATMMMDEEVASRGEIEIEKIPTHMIEATSKDLVPIFDYIQTPKFQQMRTPAMDNKINEQLLHQCSKLSEKCRISPRSILGSPERMTNSDGPVAEFKTGIEGNEWDDHLILAETKGFVNNSDTLKPNTRNEIVIIEESS